MIQKNSICTDYEKWTKEWNGQWTKEWNGQIFFFDGEANSKEVVILIPNELAVQVFELIESK